jgi:hypothetical protein
LGTTLARSRRQLAASAGRHRELLPGKAGPAAEDAWFVQSIDLSSPMGWGVAAFREEDAARAFHAAHGGELMTWADTGTRAWDAPPAPDGHQH